MCRNPIEGAALTRANDAVSANLQCSTIDDMRAAVTVNRRGVITLPARLRKALGVKADDVLIAETTSEGLLLRPAVTLPVEIYTEERVREFDEEEADLASCFGPDSK